MHIKDFPVRIKAVGPDDGLQEGQYDAIVSVFNNEDSVGDVVMPGAFTEDLARWESKGDPMPVVWSHDWLDPWSHIGYTLTAEEIAEGLRTRNGLDIADNPKAAQVYRLMKGRRVTQMSFAYDILDAGWGERDGREVFELRKLQIFETGPCLLGANQETELLDIKARQLAARVKRGTVIDLGAVRKVHDTLTALLAESSESTTGSDASTKDAATQHAGQPADDANDTAARAPHTSSAAPSSSRSAQAAARLSLVTLTNGDTQ